MQDHRLPAVESGLSALVQLAEAGGGSFLSRRMTQQAWPTMVQLLRHGPRRAPAQDLGNKQQQRNSLLLSGQVEGDSVEEHAPAAVERARLAVMTTVNR